MFEREARVQVKTKEFRFLCLRKLFIVDKQIKVLLCFLAIILEENDRTFMGIQYHAIRT